MTATTYYRPPDGAVRPFRFGVNLKRAATVEKWAETARRIEGMGYSTLFVGDHIRDQWGPLVAMTAAADATTSLRVGTSVLNNDLRNPVMLAQEIATLDVVSEGRVELGLGAGYNPSDYAATGIPLDPPPVRIERMREATRIMKAYWRDGVADHAGAHFRVENAQGYPRPFSTPWPPLCIGGGGRKVLTIAGEEADIVSLSPNLRAGSFGPEAMATAGPAAFLERVEWVRAAAGARFVDIELHVSVLFGGVGKQAAPIVDKLSREFGLTGAEIKSLPIVLAGDVDEICETLEMWRETYGISYVSVSDFRAFRPVVERLAGGVVPSPSMLARVAKPVRSRLGKVKRQLRPPAAPAPVDAPAVADEQRGTHRVLMIGAGGMGEIWLRKYVPTLGDRVTIAGLVDVAPGPLQQQGDLLGVPAECRYTSISDAFGAAGSGALGAIDACFVVVPPAFHTEAIVAAAANGIHVLCEKPLAGDWQDCVRALRAVRDAGIKAQVVQNYRYIEAVEAAKEVLDSGVLGDVHYLVSQFAADYRVRDSWGAPFRHQIDHPMLIEGAAHHLDQARYLVGSNFVSLTAMEWRPAGETGFDGAPCAFVIGAFENGARYSYEGNAVASGLERSWRDEYYRVECANGTLTICDGAVTVSQKGERGLTSTPVPLPPTNRAGHQVLLAQFADWLDGGPPPPTTIEDNIHTAAALFAAIDSTKTDCAVSLDRYLADIG